MAKDFIGYQALADAALRGVVRDALKRVEKQGLVGAHHFRITFKTNFPGVEIPDFLREQYPDEMMIILQHQFWGLKVKENHFEVTLSFKKVPATLTVPFAALTQFADPGVSFGLQFREAGAETEPVKPSAEAPTPLPAAPKQEQPAEPVAEKPAAQGEVVSLDAFRKK
ncbi:MAG TPA: ClpXP protease specificity-enhancing factor SspB [Rhizomicrobium sp.]|nr:ClpXP protease specificity-enhancing factor SspB [Rhizomicrobium sp.]